MELIKPMKVSIIICTYTPGRFEDLHEAIQSVMNQTYKPDEIIIAVDLNKELSKRLKSEFSPSIKVVLNANTPGLSETRNVGIRASEGDIVAFIDDDAVAERNWLERLLRHYSDASVAGVGGKSIPIWNNGYRPSWFPEELNWLVGSTYKGHPNICTPVRNIIGCNMSFRHDVFQKIGMFLADLGVREQKGYAEETEFCVRVKYRLINATILYEPEAIIYHKVPKWRVALNYIISKSFDQGMCKAKLQKLSQRFSQNSLSTETNYLRYLFSTSVPERLKRFYQVGPLLQIGVIGISILATGLGYIAGKLK